jgi:hypothetical protein
MRVSLFTFELDGITAETPEQAYEWQQQYEQYLDETAAEGAWLKAAEAGSEEYVWDSFRTR